MRQNLKSANDGSQQTALSRPQKPAPSQSRKGRIPTSAKPVLALFRRFPRCAGEVSTEVIDLNAAEYAALDKAAAPAGDGILTFMVNAALGKKGAPVRKAQQAKAVRGDQSCLCLYDTEAGEAVTEIPLTRPQLGSVGIASYRQHTTAGQFIANAINEKLAACGIADSTSARSA